LARGIDQRAEPVGLMVPQEVAAEPTAVAALVPSLFPALAAAWLVLPGAAARPVEAQPQAAAHAERPAEEAVAPMGAAAVEAVPDAAAEVGAEPAAGAGAAAVARGVPGELPSGLPWAWVCRQDPLPPWPAPPPSAPTARAMELSPIAWL